MTPLGDPAQPHPKARQLARGHRRSRRKIASPKQWQAITAEKLGPCRVCLDPCSNGHVHGRVHLHHIVTRQDGGDDTADNIAPLCPGCHDLVTRREPAACLVFVAALTELEVDYVIGKAGERYFERAYGARYNR